jgi:hypothetical protein
MFPDADSSFDFASNPDPISYFSLLAPVMGRSPNPGEMANYVQNFEKRKAVRGSLYPPGMGPMHPNGAGGSVTPMPNPAAGFGIDQSQVDAANTALAPFGLQTPEHINPFLFFHDQDANGNPTWAGNHPNRPSPRRRDDWSDYSSLKHSGGSNLQHYANGDGDSGDVP